MVGTRGKKIDIHELLQSNKQRSPAHQSRDGSPRKGHGVQTPPSQEKSFKSAGGKWRSETGDPSDGISNDAIPELDVRVPPVKRGRGRPRKIIPNETSPCTIPSGECPVVKAKRGRPRKLSSPREYLKQADTAVGGLHQSSTFGPSSKKQRGRPRKVTAVESPSDAVVKSSPHPDDSSRIAAQDGVESSLDDAVIENSRASDPEQLDDVISGCSDAKSVQADGKTADTMDWSPASNRTTVPNDVETRNVFKRPGSPLLSSSAKKQMGSQEMTQAASVHAATRNTVTMNVPKDVSSLKLSWSKNTRDSNVREDASERSVAINSGSKIKADQHQNVNSTLISENTDLSASCVQSAVEKGRASETEQAGIITEPHTVVSLDVSSDGRWPVVGGQSETGTDVGDGSGLSALVDEAANQVILIVPSKFSDSQVEQYITDNLVNIPNPYIIKHEPAEGDNASDDMNSLDVLVQLAVEDGRMQNLDSQDPGKTAFSQMPVYFPHLSICREPIPLKICDREDCMCNLYHCQLCQPQHGGAFTKSIMRTHYDYHRKKGTQYGDYSINVCLLDCNTKPHLHCPLCGTTVEYLNKSISAYLSHLAVCVERERYKSQVDLKLAHYDKDAVTGTYTRDGSATPVCSSVLVPHPSIIHVDEQLEEMRCTPDNGCNCEYSHCPLCPIDKQQFKYQCKAAKHFQFHMKHCIIFNGYRIMICLLPCCVYSHYHCPLCGSTFQRKCDLQIHVTRRCKGPARKRKRKSGTIDQNLVEMYSSGENLSVSYLKRVNADEADGILSMCAVNTRLIDVSQINIPHISIIHKDTTIHPTHCVKSEHTCQCAEPYCLLCAERRLVTGCNCGQYHCVMCPQSKLTAKRIPRARDHIHSHYKKAIPFKDHLVLSCGLLECVPEKRHGYHYHCPQCGVITFLIECFRRHLYSGCQVKETYFRFVDQGKSTGVTSINSTRQISNTSIDYNSPLIQVKQEITTSQDKDEETGGRGLTNKNTTLAEQGRAETSQPEEADHKVGIIKALPSIRADQLLKAKAASAIRKPSKTEVLQCVSADLQEDVLSRASPSGPEELLATLHRHLGVSYERCTDTGTYRVRGSWEMLETASTVILELMDARPKSMDDVLAVIKGHVKAAADESVNSADNVYVEETPSSDTAPDCGQPAATTRRQPDADESYWEEVNNLDKYFESKKNLNLAVRCTSCRKRLASLNNLIIHWKAKPACLRGVDVDGLPESYGKVADAVRQIDEPTCPGCGKRFLNLVSCVSHYVRAVCRRNDSFRRMVEFGISQDAMSSAYRCPKCPYTSMGKRHVVSHYEKRHLPKLYPCPYEKCRAELATSEALQRHVDVVHVNPTRNKVPCELCGLPLKRSSMQYHLISRHSELSELPRLSCQSCDYTSWSSVNLRLHVINKHGEKRHRCKYCGKGFGAISKLNQHVAFVHEKVRRYASGAERTMTQCQLCNAVLYKKNMTRHIQTVHVRQTRYPCHGCDKVFYDKRARWLHNLCHLTNGQNERVYLFRCPTCQKGFNRRWWYAEHVQNAHSAGKPYQCAVCGRAFRYKLLYNRHMASHAPVSSECSVCRNVFSSVRSLRLHMATKHAHRGLVGCPCGLQFTSLTEYRDHRLVCRHGDDDDVGGGVGDGGGPVEEPTRPIVVTNENSEILVSDGIRYETTVVDLTLSGDGQLNVAAAAAAAAAGEERVVDDDPEAVLQNATVEHLEAAQTLESIAVIPQESVEDGDRMAPADNHDKANDGDGQMVAYAEADDIALVLSAKEAENGGQDGGPPEDQPQDDGRMVVIETNDSGEVFLRTADGRQLSDDESRRILLQMNENQDEGRLLALEADDEPGSANDGQTEEGVTGGYMCGFCSVIYESLDDMDNHIRLSHNDQLADS